MIHLSMGEIAAEVERLANPALVPEGRDSPVASHLRECALCRERVSALHAQDVEVARAYMAHTREVLESGGASDVSARVAAMMNRLRADVSTNRRTSEGNAAEAVSETPQSDPRSDGQPPSAPRRGGVTIGVLSFAAGAGFALLVPALRSPVITPASSAVALVPAGQRAIRDSVPGFEGKQYIQKVNAGSGVNLVVQGINSADFDCELYDSKQATPLAVDNGIQNSCRFSLVASEAGEYRLVVKNKVGVSTSYMMVAQVVSEAPRGAGRAGESGAVEGEPLRPGQ